MGRLDGKVAVVTGATSGIGEATARLFHAEGAQVIASGRSEERGEKLSSDLGKGSCFIRADASREDEIEQLVASAAAKFGHIDILFNNAGAPVSGDTLETITSEDLTEGLRLLVGSVVFGTKYVAPVMADNGGGSIINNSSIAGQRAGQGGLIYSAAKAAVTHVTTLTAGHLGPLGIRVNAISPGAIATPIFWGGLTNASTLSDEDNARKLAKLERKLARAVPLPRSGTSDDIARAALFLASDEAQFITGHDLVVDGGRLAVFTEPALV